MRIDNRIRWFGTWALLFLLGIPALSSCERSLDVREDFPFHITTLPYHNQVEVNSDAEVRCQLAEEGRFADRTYTIRYFTRQGRGVLRVGQWGKPMEMNDEYPLQAGTFRLYYTPLTSGSHTIEITLKSNAGRVEHLVLNFNAPSKGGDSTPDTKEGDVRFPKEGAAYLGANGNWWIDGRDTGIASHIQPVKIGVNEEGKYTLNGTPTSVEAKPNEEVNIDINAVGNYTINGVDSGVKAQGKTAKGKGKVSVDDDGFYNIDGKKTPIRAPHQPNDIEQWKKEVERNGEKVDDRYIQPTLEVLAKYKGKPVVILVSKGITSQDPSSGEEITTPGVMLKGGGVVYRVYDEQGNPAPYATVWGIPGLLFDRHLPPRFGPIIRTTDKDGYLLVDNFHLPLNQPRIDDFVGNVVIEGRQWSNVPIDMVPTPPNLELQFSHQSGNDFYFQLVHRGGSSGNEVISAGITLQGGELKVGVYALGLVQQNFLFGGGFTLPGLGGVRGIPVPVNTSLQGTYIVVTPREPVVNQPVDWARRPFFVSIGFVGDKPYGFSRPLNGYLLGLTR